jgi:hypothetical protein
MLITTILRPTEQEIKTGVETTIKDMVLTILSDIQAS